MESLRRLRWLVIATVAVVLVVVVGARFVAHKAKKLATPDKARAAGLGVPVRTALVADQPMDVMVGAPGVTAASETVPVRFGTDPRTNELNPTLRAVRVRDGAYVKTGDTLFEFESQHFSDDTEWKTKALETARATLAYAQAGAQENAISRQTERDAAAAELEFRVADMEYRKEDYTRLSKLYRDGHASLTEYLQGASYYADAQYHWTQAVYRDRVAKAEMVTGPVRDQKDIASAMADVQAKTFDLGLSTADLDRCALRSPIDGYVDQVVGGTGQIVTVDLILAEVLKVEPMQMQVDFPQERVGELQIGQSVDVVLDSFPKETFAGKVVRVSAHVDQEKRVLPVIVELPNADRRIKVGVSGYARVHAVRQTTTAPAVAIIGLDSQAMAFVVKDGRAQLRQVRPGPVVDVGYRAVESGLAAGDEVVIYGQQDVRDGEPVNTNWREWERRD